MLDQQSKRRLRGLCHALSPVVIVAGKGLSESVCAEIDAALESHELIKIKLRADREQRRIWAESIAQRSGAELVQQIGQTACFFRPNPNKRRILV
ncbi:MAG: ribosome assembly RNA-binding protein YhbY [Wenzhouxiangellaceae bacterium]